MIEVKGRHADARDVIITKIARFWRLSTLPEAFIFAVVRVSAGFAHQPAYVRRFAQRDPGFAETAVVFNLDDLTSSATPPG